MFLVLLTGPAQAAPLDQPTPETLAEARRIVQEMIRNPRGPYSRILWYCNDGTTQPPIAYACRERGGGRQHAEYSADRERLARLGWSVGTIFAPLEIADLMHSAPRQQRLRELALERYLIDIDNGWVLQRALGYRGRVQVEDENAAGRALLLSLVSDTDFGLANYLLIRESARVIPHGEETDLARTVRRAAVELAELDPAAEPWRAEIHGTPTAATAQRLRQWLARQRRDDVKRLGEGIAVDLDALYGESGRRERLHAALNRLRSPDAAANFRNAIITALDASALNRIDSLCNSLAVVRGTGFGRLPPDRRLALIDALPGVETEVQLSYQELIATQSLTRSELLSLSESLLNCAYGSGLLSGEEVDSLRKALSGANRAVVSLDSYRNAVNRLKRAPGWAIGTIRHTFAEALIRYTALDPRAARFADDLLRSSPMWILGDTLRILSRDVDQLYGSVVELNGQMLDTAVALNGGIARGPLRIFETIEAVEHATLAPGDIVVLPETIAELSPVAGILTLGEGNALSHVQLLARNFGIPNVAIDQGTVDILRPLSGRDVLLAVDDGGDVLLAPVDDRVLSALQTLERRTPRVTGLIDVPMPDLGLRELLPLARLGRELSGLVVGPKAANLGELNRLFPGRVAPAIAIPFGVYAAHLRIAGLDRRIADAFAGHAAGRLSANELNAELADVRKQVAALELSSDLRARLEDEMAEEFGEPGSYGVFVRSDTNVEDLPQFTGAGLNETVPHVVGLEAQLATVPRVWSSVLSPRALAWRSSVLSNPARIYASVLLMQSVAATKSGVLVTANLFDRRTPGLTASTAWGIGGAVAGEAAETVVITADDVELVTAAKSPYQRRLAAAGGIEWIPAEAGRVLDEREIAALRELVEEVSQKYEPVPDDTGRPRPWDIEFGFVDGELTLFQIRPLVERNTRNADALLNQLRPRRSKPQHAALSVSLNQPPGTQMP